MYHILALLSGVITAIMVAFNGGLSDQVGVYSATVIIHSIGFILIVLLILIYKENPFAKRMPWPLYLGGAIGVAVTAFQNIAFNKISISAILAFCLLGQGITSIVCDQFGIANGKKEAFVKKKILGFLLIGGGAAVMITNFDLLSVIVSFLSGVGLVISRILNARLAEGTSIRLSTFFNYLVGLVLSIVVMICFGRNEPLMINWQLPSGVLIYLGGLLGVSIILISNIITTKISSFNVTLFIFIGQLFSGILLDAIIYGSFISNNLLGGILVTIGFTVNLFIDKSKQAKLTSGK